MAKLKVFDVALISIFSAIIFAIEYAMQILPNVQLTVLLIVLFSKKLGIIRASLIVLIYTILDTCFMGAFNFMYFPFMLISWILIPITINTVFKKCETPFSLALLGVLYSFIFSWIMIIPGVFIMNVNFMDYLVADVVFEIILAASSFLSILWLYKPLSSVLEKILITDRND